MRYVFIRLNYSVSSGISDTSFEFEAKDVLAVEADNPFLRSNEGLKALVRELLANSTRGGGITHAQYSNIRAEVTESREYKRHPSNLERGASFYEAGLCSPGLTVSQSLQRLASEKSYRALDKKTFTEMFHEASKQENRTKALKTRYTSASELAKYKKRQQRAEKAIDALLSDPNSTFEEISKSRKFKDASKRAKEASSKIEHLLKKRAEYAEKIKSVKTQKQMLEQAHKEFNQTLEQRVREAIRQRDESSVKYRMQLIEKPHAYDRLSKREIEAREREKLIDEMQEKPVIDTSEYEIDDHIEQEMLRMSVSNRQRMRQ